MLLGLQPWRASLRTSLLARRSLLTSTVPPRPPNTDAADASNPQLSVLLDSLQAGASHLTPRGLRNDSLVDSPPIAGPSGYQNRGPPKRNFKNAGLRMSDSPMDSYIISNENRPRYRLHVFSNRNNTRTVFTDAQGDTLAWWSSGRCGFKNAQRSTYEAGYQCAVRIFKEIEDVAAKTKIELDVLFSGFGMGRDALYRAMLTTEGEKIRPLVVSITDRTPIKIGGTRSKKARRL